MPSRSASRPRSAASSRSAATPRAAAGPPVLRLHLLRLAGTLLVMNLLPLGVMAYVLLVWDGQGLHLRPGLDQRVLAVLGTTLICCLLIAVSGWVLYPVARWLRDWPWWHFTHGSRLLWALPTALGTALWAGLGLLCLTMTLGALFLVAVGVQRVIAQPPAEHLRR